MASFKDLQMARGWDTSSNMSVLNCRRSPARSWALEERERRLGEASIVSQSNTKKSDLRLSVFRLPIDCWSAIAGNEFDVTAEVKRLHGLLLEERLGPSTRSIVEAAKARGIPTTRLNKGSLVRLGQGSRQRRIIAAETDATPAIAEAIAQDKELTRPSF